MDHYVGEKLGNYRLVRLLGSGGFAEVYLGEHIYLKTQAAIKVLRVSLEAEALDQFLTEARTIAHLEHPNIVRTLEFGVQGSTAYLVMSYAPNGTVLRRYPRGSIVPLHMIIQYVSQIADALQYAHAHELIHRDVKPENILLGRDGEVLLSDFGLAILSPVLRSSRPMDKAGTIPYMAPEQVEGKPSKSSDQYGLGVVVYEWLCGRLPFTGLEEEIALQHLQVPPPPLSKRSPSVPLAIEQVVMKALAKDPSQRFLSVLHFAQVLEEAYQPYKLVQVLRSSSKVQSVDARDTPLKHDTYSRTEPEPFSGPQSPSVPSSADDDKVMSSPQNMLNMLTSQAAPEPSVQPPRRISRRVILAGLAGLTAVSAVSAGAVWSFRDLRFSASSSRGSSSKRQSSRVSQATPGTMSSPTSGSSTPQPTPSNPHATPTQNVGSTPGTTPTPTAMPTPQVTPTANTTSTSAYTSTANTAPTPIPTPTLTFTPTPQPQPTQSGSNQGQQNGQGQNDQ